LVQVRDSIPAGHSHGPKLLQAPSTGVGGASVVVVVVVERTVVVDVVVGRAVVVVVGGPPAWVPGEQVPGGRQRELVTCPTALV